MGDLKSGFLMVVERSVFEMGFESSQKPFEIWTKSRFYGCYSTVTCKVFIESTTSLLNRPQRNFIVKLQLLRNENITNPDPYYSSSSIKVMLRLGVFK